MVPAFTPPSDSEYIRICFAFCQFAMLMAATGRTMRCSRVSGNDQSPSENASPAIASFSSMAPECVLSSELKEVCVQS